VRFDTLQRCGWERPVHYNRCLIEREASLVNGGVPPERVLYDIYHDEAGVPFEATDFEGLDTHSVTRGL
jgi:hypothetical protein